MNTFRKQYGMSMWGALVIAAMSGVFLIAGLKLFPVYMEYYSILGIIEQMQSDPSIKGASKEKIADSFSKRLSLSDVTNLTKNDYSITKVQGRNSYTIDFYYEVRKTLFGNLSIVAEFERSEEVGEGAGGE
jgi:hypothetical protein